MEYLLVGVMNVLKLNQKCQKDDPVAATANPCKDGKGEKRFLNVKTPLSSLFL